MILKESCRKAREYIFDSSIKVDRRMAACAILTSIVAGFINLLLGVFVHLPIRNILIVGGALCIEVLVILLAKVFHRESQIRHIVIAMLFLMMPLEWILCGGFYSSSLIMLGLASVCMMIFAKKRELAICLLLTLLMSICCFGIEYIRPEVVFHLASLQDQLVSVIGGVLIFDAALCFIFCVQKLLYKQEKKESETKNSVTLEFITTIATIIDAKDNYTGGHSKRVSECAVAIAEAMGMSQQEQEEMRVVGLLHDIGKIGIPDSVLNKPGRLNDSEYELIKRHPMIGAEILKTLYFIPHVYEGALYHHERYDGEGYPIGLKGEEIPLFARIICIADSFDAMSTNRVYRKNVSRDEIIAEFTRCRGKQFDPEITDVFIQLLKKGYETRDELIRSDVDAQLAVMMNSQAAAVKTQEAMKRERFVIDAMRSAGRYNGALNLNYLEFSKMYEYLLKMGFRFEHETTLALIRLKEEQIQDMSTNDIERASNSLHKAILSNVRGVDVCTKYSETEYLIMLINATEKNLTGILNRVERSYRTISDFYSPDMEYQVLKYPGEQS